MSRGDLYLDLLQIVLNAAEVKKLIVVPFNEEYGKEVENVLRECALEMPDIKKRQKTLFISVWRSLPLRLYAVGRCWGIR